MRNKLGCLLIVEGIQDESFISSIFDVEIVKTQGNVIPKEEIEYIKESQKNKKIVILTDSDEAGKRIRERLNPLIENAINIELDITKCNKNNKHGVAESSKEELIEKLSRFTMDNTKDKEEITTSDLVKLSLTGPNSSERRNKVIKELKLGICNTKTLLKRLNYRNIKLSELKGILDGNK